MALSNNAKERFESMATDYAKDGYPAANGCYFEANTSEEQAVMRELAAQGLVLPRNLIETKWSFTERGARQAVGAIESGEIHVHLGTTIMNHKNVTNTITNSNVGAFANEGATATGSVTVQSQGFNQMQHNELMKQAKHAMVDDEEKLDAATREALWQFLKIARETQVAVADLASTQAKMKETVDELWAKEAANGMKPQALSQALEVVKVLVSNPVTAVAVKALIGVA